MEFVKAFVVGGFICAIGQVLIDRTKIQIKPSLGVAFFMPRHGEDYPFSKIDYFVPYEKILPPTSAYHLYFHLFFCPSEGPFPTVLGSARNALWQSL